MPSEHGLHPLSVFFQISKQIAGLIPPLVLLLLGSRSEGLGWELMGGVFLVAYSVPAFTRYLSFRYRYEPEEMVIRSGVFFRNERHVPYARIQNLEAVQNVLHRAFGVVEVRVQTGGGDEPEATMTVIRLDALDEMRRRVFEGRAAGPAHPPVRELAAAQSPRAEPGSVPATEAETILRIPARELMLSGFIENRGLLVIAAAIGLVAQLDIVPSIAERFAERGADGIRSARTEAIRAAFSGSGVPLRWILILAAAVVVFLLFTRVLSMGWALLRLHGFTATRSGDAVRVEFGLFTRLTTSIPLRRIQQLTIRETPLHRLTKRASVRVTTAGGAGKGETGKQREWLAPIIRRADLPRFLDSILPGVGVPDFEWQPVHPRAFRRAVVKSAFVAAVVAVATAGLLRWYSLVLLPILLVLAAVQARLYVGNLGWAKNDSAVGYRRGAFWNYVTVARFTKIQAVSLRESPFDRRHGMARLVVDTAGSSENYKVAIPYLGRETAGGLLSDLSAKAGRTTLSW